MERLDGRTLSILRREQLRERVQQCHSQTQIAPCLAVVLVGDDPASHVYVRNKIKSCSEVGVKSLEKRLPARVSQAQLIQEVQELNANSDIHAILVQLPLPEGLNSEEVLSQISPLKDADGLVPENLGLLLGDNKRVAPCTPAGVIELLKAHGIPMNGAHAVVVGRSQIVGKPMALLLLAENATVTVCHSQTKDLANHTRQADIVVVAAGRPEFLGKEHFKQGSVVVDVGIHRKANGKLCGDVNSQGLESWLKALSPVPGGVGPMTITMLLENTLMLAELQRGQG